MSSIASLNYWRLRGYLSVLHLYCTYCNEQRGMCLVLEIQWDKFWVQSVHEDVRDIYMSGPMTIVPLLSDGHGLLWVYPMLLLHSLLEKMDVRRRLPLSDNL